MQQRIVLIGAGSAQFGFGTLSDIFASKVLEGSEIVCTISTAGAQANSGCSASLRSYACAPFTLSATTDRKTALQGANHAISPSKWAIASNYGKKTG